MQPCYTGRTKKDPSELIGMILYALNEIIPGFNHMAISATSSVVTMPAADKPYPSILEFLTRRFPNIGNECWQQRINEGKVLAADNSPISADTPYSPDKRLFYFREVAQERLIPFAEKILFQDDHLLVACKPHFLPVIPGGGYVNECLLNRLRAGTGNDDLVPLHRIDRETAGIVMFSVNSDTRGLYGRLFANGMIDKHYQALAECNREPEKTDWTVENRIVKGDPWFRMKVVPGQPNSRSNIRLLDVNGNIARFDLFPVTGKTHQLRIHMGGLGFRILNDRYYPDLQPEQPDDFENPLRLIAKTLRFRDPVSGKSMEFCSERELPWQKSYTGKLMAIERGTCRI
jgi:tRNA pseudouridine32 synthase/23S rRNA pseudouridine746 synthase